MKPYIYFFVTLLLAACKIGDDELTNRSPAVDPFEYNQEEIERDDALIDTFIAENSLEVIETASGLRYIIEQEGSGRQVAEGDGIIAHYTGRYLENGEEFDASNREDNPNGFAFRYRDLLPGVQEGLLLAREGTVIRLLIPSYLGYGKSSFFTGIGSATNLDFTFEVNIVLK